MSSSTPRRRRVLAPAAAAAVLALALGACTDNPATTSNGGSDGGSGTQAEGGPLSVDITDDGCDVSATSIPSGQVTFQITNKGTVPNEFEILAEDKLRIMSEQENIGPGTSTQLTTALPEGTYFTACKPNMVGALVGDKEFEVTAGDVVAVDKDTEKAEKEAVTNYTSYVKDQVGNLVDATEEFTDAYTSGDTEKAKELFPQARKYYERIEPTAEAFGIEKAGDLDEAMDLRVQDVAADAGKDVTDPSVLKSWTGWHRIEADLFTDEDSDFAFADDAARKTAADKLNDDTGKLYDLVYGKIDGASGTFELSLADVVNGSQGLMDEVATSKIVGEEDTFSHTDLYDFQANLDGARVAYGNVQAIVQDKDKKMDASITEKFDAVQKELDQYTDGKSPDGDPAFVDYSSIASVQKDAGTAPGDGDYTKKQRAISDSVNAISEELSQVAGVVLH
jgi:iron uptake system component EfeO